MANAEKLNRLVDVVSAAAERGEWDQRFYAAEQACGTTLCAAGWQAVLDGHTLTPNAEYRFSDVGPVKITWVTDSGQSIISVATDSLELTRSQVEALFISNFKNDLELFKLTVKKIIAGEIE